jgi:hypothetical protein
MATNYTISVGAYAGGYLWRAQGWVIVGETQRCGTQVGLATVALSLKRDFPHRRCRQLPLHGHFPVTKAISMTSTEPTKEMLAPIAELSDVQLDQVSGGAPAKDPPMYLHFYFKLVAVKTVGWA